MEQPQIALDFLGDLTKYRPAYLCARKNEENDPSLRVEMHMVVHVHTDHMVIPSNDHVYGWSPQN